MSGTLDQASASWLFQVVSRRYEKGSGTICQGVLTLAPRQGILTACSESAAVASRLPMPAGL